MIPAPKGSKEAQRPPGGRCASFPPGALIRQIFPFIGCTILSAEETALRFLRAAVAAQFHKNGSFEPLLWNSAIAAMRISIGKTVRRPLP